MPLPKIQAQISSPLISDGFWSLARIRQRRRDTWVAVIYTVYGDESFDLGAKRVFAVGGIFGRQHEWDELSPKWFNKTGGLDFHAADCDSDHGAFSQNDHRVNQNIYRSVTKLLCSTKLLGVAMVVDLEAHQKHFPAAMEGEPYYTCFAHVLLECAQLGYLHVPPGEVKFTLRQKLDKQHNATVLYDYMSRMPGWKYHPYLAGEVGFASRKGNVGIQAADLFARESMKVLDNEIGPVKRYIRGSAQALRETRRFSICVMDNQGLFSLARRAEEFGKTLAGANVSEFQEWLGKNRLTDNTTNRILYLAEIDRLNPK